MTQWTPKLEKLIREYAAFELKNVKDGANPKISVAGTMLRSIFHSAITRNGHYNTLCAEMGLAPDSKAYYKNIQAIIDLAKANNSDAAEGLEKTRAFWKQYGSGSMKQVIASMKKAKRDGFQL